MAKQFTLARHERLKSRKLIEELFSKGQRFGLFPFRVFYLLEKKADGLPATAKLQCGVGVSSKNFKKAVDRNRIKRVTREGYRLQKNELATVMQMHSLHLSVFLIYTGKELPEFLFVKEKIALILQKLITIVNEETVANS